MSKIKALSKYLGEDKDEIEETKWDTLEFGNQEYLVLTDDEADQRAADYIKESIWTFNSNFLLYYLPEGIDENTIKIIQEKCEDANEPLKNMIVDLDQFVEDAISADGRGHFLAGYDGNEYEQDKYFIYRVN